MPIPESLFGSSILILAPHPDDEVVACAAAIGRAQAQGSKIFALYLTNGCIAKETLWPWQRKNYDRTIARRRAEAEQAAKFLGITPAGWSQRPARHLWRHLPEVFAEAQRAIAAHEIDQLWVPAYEGGNADHDALNAVGSLFVDEEQLAKRIPLPLRERIENLSLPTSANLGFLGEGSLDEGSSSHPNHEENPSPSLAKFAPQKMAALTKPNYPLPQGERKPPVLEFAEYNYANGKAHSQEFPAPNGTEKTLILTPEERRNKQAALEIYASEKQNLNYVRTERECFRPLASYDYSQPPHSGTLWYARFQWVPFRHPRVDFTKPEEVSAAIKKFSCGKKA